MADDTGSSPADPGEFVVVEPVYVIAPSPPPADQLEALRRLARGTAPGPDGTPTTFVVAFTDRDLAEQFVRDVGPPGAALTPLRLATRETFAVALENLARMGVTHVAFDPGPEQVRVLDVARVIHGLRHHHG
jgi:hypothetical protein